MAVTLSLLVSSQVCGNWVVLDCLVQHEGHETRTIRHGCPDIALLLKQFIQLVPLGKEKR